MPTWTPQQLAAMSDLIYRSQGAFDPSAAIQPGYTLDQIYGFGAVNGQGGWLPAPAQQSPVPSVPQMPPTPVPPQSNFPVVPATGPYATVPTPMDIQAAAKGQQPSGGARYFPPGQDYGYNAATGNWEVKQPGQAYTSVKAPKFGPQSPAVAAIDGASRLWPNHSPAMTWENPQVVAGAPLGMTPGELRAAQGDPWAGRRSPSENAAARAAPSLPQALSMHPLAQLAALFAGGLSKGPPKTSPFAQTASGGSLNGAHEDNMSAADYIAAAQKGGATADQLANLRRMYGL